VTPAALAAALLLAAAPPAVGPRAEDGPTPEAVAAAETGPIAVAPFSLSLGGGSHPLRGLGGWVGAARAGVHLAPHGPLALGPLSPELSLQVTYGWTPEGAGLGRFLVGATWWFASGRLHAGLGGSAGWTWLDAPARLAPGLTALVEAVAGVELARLKGVRVSLDLRGGLDPWHAGEPELLALLAFRY
jgi:hypothetical protein